MPVATVRRLLENTMPTGAHDTLLGLKMGGIDIDAPLPVIQDGPAFGVPTPVLTSQVVANAIRDIGLAMKSGQVIQAIKVMRSTTGLGLKESKDIIDLFPRPPLPMY